MCTTLHAQQEKVWYNFNERFKCSSRLTVLKCFVLRWSFYSWALSSGDWRLVAASVFRPLIIPDRYELQTFQPSVRHLASALAVTSEPWSTTLQLTTTGKDAYKILSRIGSPFEFDHALVCTTLFMYFGECSKCIMWCWLECDNLSDPMRI